jgi:hypothetical protein
MGTSIENIKGLKIKGQSILQKEIDHSLRIPSD